MNSVLAVFAKAPHPGRVKTRLAPSLSPKEGAELYRCMLFDTVARVQLLAVETIIFFDGDEGFFRSALPGRLLIPQRGADLGERMENAFETLSSLGYGARVLIGTDAPDLPLGYIKEAFRLIREGQDAVFGPAEDGGYYLVALGGAPGDLFRDIPWSSLQVLSKSLQRASEAGLATALLPTWYDVDCYEDLHRPGLTDPGNGAPLTRDFLRNYGIGVAPAATLKATTGTLKGTR